MTNGKQKSKTIYIVKDPKTYINAEEAWFKFSEKDKDQVLVVIIPRNDPNSTLPTFKNVINDKIWDQIHYFYTFSNDYQSLTKKKMKKSLVFKLYREFLESIYQILDKIRLKTFSNTFHNVQIVFSGHKNTQEHLAYLLNPSELIIMDSGLKIRKQINSEGYFGIRKYGLRKNPVKFIVQKLAGFSKFDRKKTKFFTTYKDSISTNHKILINDYAYRQHLIKNKTVGEKILFVSSPIFIFDGISINQYIEFIRAVFDKLKIAQEDVIYIPHPTYEDDVDIDKIVKALNCDFDKRKIPIEAKITLYKTIPKICISPFSSSLVNLTLISDNKFKIISAWHFQFECFLVLKEWKQNVLQSDDSGIEILNLTSADTPPIIKDLTDTKCSQPVYNSFRDFEIDNKL